MRSMLTSSPRNRACQVGYTIAPFGFDEVASSKRQNVRRLVEVVQVRCAMLFCAGRMCVRACGGAGADRRAFWHSGVSW